MPERQGADHQAGHDLVADAEQQRSVEHVMRQRDPGGHRDQVAAEQRQLHPVAALGDAVAHCRHAAGELPDPAAVAQRCLEDRGVGLKRLVCGQHVVVGRDDRHVGLHEGSQRLLVRLVHCGDAVREIGAGELASGRAALRGEIDAGQVGGAGIRAALGDSRGDVVDHGMDHAFTSSCQRRPSRSINVVAAGGPAAPAM